MPNGYIDMEWAKKSEEAFVKIGDPYLSMHKKKLRFIIFDVRNGKIGKQYVEVQIWSDEYFE